MDLSELSTYPQALLLLLPKKEKNVPFLGGEALQAEKKKRDKCLI
jgi:hypothetical protein